MAMHVVGSNGHMTLHFKDVVGVGTKDDFINVAFSDGRVFGLEFNNHNDRDRAYQRIKQEQEKYAKTINAVFEMKQTIVISIPWLVLIVWFIVIGVANRFK